jgi:putative glutamine amidotransferase
MPEHHLHRARPLIALTTDFAEKAGRHQRPQATIYGAYLARIQEAGLTPVLITPLHDEAAIRQIVSSCAGLVLTGGEDVDPHRYGEEPLPDLCFVTPARDAAEWLALDCALQQRLPVLAICRGIQVLNVHRGGSLWQDLPTQNPGTVVHEQSAPYGQPAHAVSVTPGSRLHAILGATSVRVNSYHHQAPRAAASGLMVTARADDGVIEGMEVAGPDFILGVQWHPERLPDDAGSEHPDRRLFRAFADAVHARISEVAA